MAKLIDMSLDDLYKREKITAPAFKAIASKEDFSKTQERFCDKVCTAPCYMKAPSEVVLEHGPVDIMILQKHPSMDELWKNGEALETRNETIFRYMLRSLAKRYGKPEPSWRIHNALKCIPFAKNRGVRDEIPFGKRKPLPDNPSLTATVVQRCTPYLIEEIRRAKPKVIVSTSTLATKALGFKHRSNNNHRGVIDFIEVDGRKIPVIFTLHPEVTCMIRQNASGAMWGPDYYTVIYRDLEKAHMLSQGNMSLKDIDDALDEIESNRQIWVTSSLEEVREAHKILKEFSGRKKILSWDTETTGLDPWADDARFLCHQFGYRREDGKVQAVVIPLWHKDNTFYDPAIAWPFVKDILEDGSIEKVAHNAAFDLKYTRVTTGVEVKGLIADTMLLLHAINSGISGNYGLKTSVWDFLPESGLGGYEDQLDVAFQEEVKNAESS